MGDHLCRRFDCIDTAVSQGRVRLQTVHMATHPLLAFMGAHRLHAGRLADDTRIGPLVEPLEHLDQATHTDTTNLLIIGEGQVDRHLQVAFQEFRCQGQYDGDKAFHIGGTPTE